MNPKTLAAVLMAAACSASAAQTQLLYDDFTSDHALNTSLWTVQSALLNTWAITNSTPVPTLVAPLLTFDASGMEMSGVTNIYEYTGFQSVTSFTPPFTLNTTVNGLVAAGCPFAIFLLNHDLSQWVGLQGNVGTNNGGYYGMWLNYTGSGKPVSNRGVSLFASPNTNVWYTFQFSIGSDGNASGVVSDAGGVEGVLSGLTAGMGPYYLILAQKEGYPSMPGPNVALWQSVRIVSGQTSPPVPPPVSLSLGLAPIWSTNGMDLELRGPSGSYLVEAVSGLSDPLRWQTVQIYSTSNWSFRYDFADLLATNYHRCFYRARQLVAPDNMVLVPSGPFAMGDAFGIVAAELPLHTNQVGNFYIDQYDVTRDLWENVRQWATNHGYAFSSTPAGKATNQPEQGVTWYDSVKWCNARSEMEGRVPAYFTDATWTTVYRTGNLDLTNTCVLWNAGYRLPTEAEWEKAARGGVAGHRFPWSDVDTISESQANYDSDATYSYDLSDTGYNPTYNDGVLPYTSPVGSFAANGFGLYDMAGNVWQWCWDWYGTYSSNLQSNPRGPDAGTMRICRGGSWHADAYYSRTACRGFGSPSGEQNSCGFRTVIGMGP